MSLKAYMCNIDIEVEKKYLYSVAINYFNIL